MRGGQALGRAAAVQLLDALGRGGGGGNRRAAGRGAVLRAEDREHAIADQLEDVAAAGVDRRDHGVGVVVQERDDLLGCGRIGDRRVASQVAEPQRCVDPVRHTARDPAAQHHAPGVPAEVGLDQGFGDAAERGAFHRQRQERRQPLQRGHFAVAETFGPVGGPGRIDAVHLADDALGCEPVHHHDHLGRAFHLLRFEEGGARLRLGTDAVSAQLLAALDQPIKRRCAPIRGRFALVRAAVFDELRLPILGLVPADRAALVDRVQRVDDHEAGRERQTGGDRTLAETGHQLGLGRADQAFAGDPFRKLREARFVHRPHPPRGSLRPPASGTRRGSGRCRPRRCRHAG